MLLSGHALTVVLGAGASRGVSYAHERDQPSPLDSDFFDLLNRLEPSENDAIAVKSVQEQISQLPLHYRRSMERAFYTLHLKAFMARKLEAARSGNLSETQIVGNFARSIQALLRAARSKGFCKNHNALVRCLRPEDSVISFNYDLVVERALRPVAMKQRKHFGDWLYGLSATPRASRLPVILKLHGSSNWRLRNEHFQVLTKGWEDFDDAPGYRGHKGTGTEFPIFLPFWDKRIEKNPWLNLWKESMLRLEATGTVLVWGYSLPPTDVKAQQLFTLALSGRRFRLCIVDPSTATRDRWRELFPEALYWEYDNIRSFLRHPPKWWKHP
jgi:hypothetical protein